MGGCNTKEDSAKNRTFILEVLEEHEGGINCAALSEDESVLATGSEDRTARLWSTKTDNCECIGILKGHEDYINCILIEDNFCITGSADKTLRKWEMSTCDCVHVFKGHNSLINRIICTGDFIFSSSYDRTSRCWDFDTGECVRVFNGHKRGVYPMIFIPIDEDMEQDEEMNERYDWDGNKDILITGSADYTARSWSFETGKCLNIFKEHDGAITCMSCDHNGKMLYTGSTDHSIRSWNVVTGERLKIFVGHQASIICMVSANKLLFTGSSDMMARSWVMDYGECTRVYKGHKHTVGCVKHHQGLLFTGCGDGITRVFDAKGGTLKRSYKGHENTINCLTIVDGKLYTGSHDGRLIVWDTTGIKDDTTFGRNPENEDKKKAEDSQQNAVDNNNVQEMSTKIMIEEV